MIPVFLPDVRIAAETVLAGHFKKVVHRFNYYSAGVAFKRNSSILDFRCRVCFFFIDTIVQLEGECLGPRLLVL